MVSIRALFPFALVALGIASAHAQLVPAANRAPTGPTTIPSTGQLPPGSVIMAPLGGGGTQPVPNFPVYAPDRPVFSCSVQEEKIKKLESLVKSQDALIKVLLARADAGKGK